MLFPAWQDKECDMISNFKNYSTSHASHQFDCEKSMLLAAQRTDKDRPSERVGWRSVPPTSRKCWVRRRKAGDRKTC